MSGQERHDMPFLTNVSANLQIFVISRCKIFKKMPYCRSKVSENGRVRMGPAVANPLGKPPEGAAAIYTTVRATRALSVTWEAKGSLLMRGSTWLRVALLGVVWSEVVGSGVAWSQVVASGCTWCGVV